MNLMYLGSDSYGTKIDQMEKLKPKSVSETLKYIRSKNTESIFSKHQYNIKYFNGNTSYQYYC